MISEYFLSEKSIPVTFNPYKHHLGFLKKKIDDWKNKPWDETAQKLKLIGNNLIDLYHGTLSIPTIINEVKTFSSARNIKTKNDLIAWLYPRAYKKIQLSDGSSWVISISNDEIRYLHIHPGKYSPHTNRVKGTGLKTVLALHVFEIINTEPNIESINRIRVQKLNLSPVKNLVEGKGIK